MSVYQTQVEGKVFAAIEPSLLQMGYEIVRIKVMRGRGDVLQIMLDRADGEPLTISDCEKATWQISAIMDVEDPMEERYSLEVGSAGLDRPLTREKDFLNHVGASIKLSVYHAISGRKRFTGRLMKFEDQKISLHVDGQDDVTLIDWHNVQDAFLTIDRTASTLKRKSTR